MAVVDNLEISIKSEVTNATKSIDTLIGKISELSSSIKSINVSNISSQISKLTTSFKNINGSGFSDVNRSLKETEQSVNKVSNAVKKVSNAKFTFNISDYDKAIEQIAAKFSEAGKSFKVSGNLEQLEKQSSKLSAELDKLFQTEQKIISVGRIAPDSTSFLNLQYNISKTTNELDILRDAINQLKSTASSTSGIEIIRGNSATVSLEHFQKELQRMDDLMQRVLNQSQIETFVSNLETSLGKLKQIFPEQTQLIEEYKNKIESFKNISVETPKLEQVFAGISKNTQINEAEERIRSFTNKLGKLEIPEIRTDNLDKLKARLEKAETDLDKLRTKLSNEITMGNIADSPDDSRYRKLQEQIALTEKTIDALRQKISQASADATKASVEAAKTLREQLKQLQVPEIKENNLEKLQNELEKTKQKMASLKVELQNKLTMGKITASVDDSGYVRMREQIALTGKTISALQDRIKVFSDASEKVTSLGNRIEELKSHLNNLQSQGFKAGDIEFDKATAALQRAEQELKQYKAILAQPSKGLQEDIQKTNSLGNHVEELRKKLDELKSRGLNFGDKEFDKAYSELQKAEEELSKYKSSLTSTQKTNISFAENVSQAFKKVSSSIGSMVSGAISSLGRLGNALTLNRSNLNNLTTGMSGFRTATSNTISSVGSLTKQIAAASGVYLGIYGAIKGIKSSIDFASSLTEVQNVINVTFGKSAKVIEDFTKTSIQKFGLSELAAKQTAGRYQAMGTALGIPTKQMANMSVELTKLSADMASFYDVAQSDVAKSLQSVFTGTTAPMRRYGVDLTVTTLEEWAHKRGIDAKIKSMSQAEKMMLRYAYVMERTGAAQKDFQRTILTWHNQLTLLKENFRELSGVIGTVFINSLKPVVIALNNVMGKVIAFSKTVLNSLGKIFGWTYEDTGGGVANDFSEEMEDAASGADDLSSGVDDVADSTDKATKKQKEFNKQLAKFDELTNYTTSEKGSDKDKDKDKDTGSPDIGDLADLGAGYGAGGEWKKSKSIFKEFQSELDSLYKLGDYIGQKLTEAMESIPWDNIYEKARNFGSGLASFLNGLISPELFAALGKTVAGSINTALHVLDSFGETFDWTNFGNSLAAGLNSFLGNIDWDTALSAVNNWGKGIADALNSFIHETDFALIGSSVAKFINTAIQGALSFIENFDFEGAGTAIATALNSFLHETDFKSIGTLVASFINGVARTALTIAENFDFSSVGSSIASFINSALGGIEWKTILTAASEWGKGIADAINSFFKETDFTLIGSTVGNFINTAINFVLSSGQELNFKEIGSKIADGINEAFKTIDFEDLAESINVWIKGALTTVTTLLQETDFEEIGKKIGTFLAELDFGEILGDIARAIWEAIKAAFGLLSGLIQEAPLETALIAAFATLKFTGIGKLIAGNIATGISRSLAVALNGLSLPLLPIVVAITGVGAALIDLWNTSEAFRDTVSNAFNKVKESLTGAFNKIKDAISPLIDSIGNLASSLYDFYEGSNIKGIVDLIASLTTSLVGSALSTAIDALGTAIAGLAEILTGAFDILSGFFDILTGIFTLDFSKAVDGFENLGKGITKAFSGIIDLTVSIGEDIIGGLLKGIADGIKTIGTWIKNSVVDPVVNKFKSLFGIHSPSTVMAEIGGYLMEGLKKGIENAIKKVTNLFSDIKNKIVGIWNDIKTKTSEVWGNISSILSTKWGDFKNWASEKFSAVALSITTAWDNAKSKTAEVWNAISSKASEVWGNLKSWASEKFESIKSSIIEAWDSTKSKTTEVWDNVSSTLKTKWNDFKSWASDKFGSVKQSVIDAWNEAKKKTTSTWKEVSDTLSTKWNDFKSWASDRFGKVKDSVIGAWKEIKNDTSSKWKDVSDTLSAKWGNFKSWASEKFGNVKDSVKGAWKTIKTKTEETWENKGSVTSILGDSWENIKSSVKDALTGKDGIVSKLSSAWDSIKTTAESAWKKIGNAILSPIEKAVNGVIKGINWVLDKVGSKTQFSAWNAPKFASGTDGLPEDTIGIVNDQSGNTYREMIVPPHGKPFIPKGRNVTLPMKKGTKIMPAAQTKEFMQSMKNMPHFAKGIGDFFGGAWSKIKEFTGNIWDYFSKPKEILQFAIDKFTDLPDIAEVPLEIAKGSVNTVLDGAVEFIKKAFETSSSAGIERAISWALKIAADNSHGYDQNSRWGNPDYDCSSFVISAFEQAGIKLKSAGATYTGDMRSKALGIGFKDVTSSVNLSSGDGLRRGDILLHAGHHVALYLGNGQLVHASINENGKITGGQPGDQNGREILTRGYYNHPWSSILRYIGKSGDNKYATGIGKINISDIVKGFAKGGLSKDELGVVNDQAGNTYKELIIPPHGTPFIPEGRNVTLPLEKGTRIIPADKTKKFLNSLPHFANGTEDFSEDKKSKGGSGIVDGIRKVMDDTIVPYIREMIRILEGNAKSSGTTVATSNKKTTTKYSDTVKEIQKAWNDLAKWFETTVVQPIEATFATMKEQIIGIFSAINEDISKNYEEYSKEWQETLQEIPEWISEGISNSVIEQFQTLFSNIQDELSNAWSTTQDTLSEVSDWIETNITSSILSKFTDMFTQIKDGFSTMWSDVSISASQELEKITGTADDVIGKLQEIINKANDAITTIERATQAQNEAAIQAQVKQTTTDISNAVQEVTSQLGNSVISTAVASIGGFSNNIPKQETKQEETKKEKYETAKLQTINTSPKTGSLDSKSVSYTTEKLASVAKETANTFVSNISEPIENALDRIKDIKFKRYATGGFPEDGWFRASKGEFMGQFDDGTSYVTNNSQIQKAISAEVGGAVYNAVIAAMSSSGNNNGGDIVVNVDGESLFRIMKNKDNNFYSRTGRGAFEH